MAELAGLHRLEQLSLRGCSRLTGLGLSQLGRLRRSLVMLNLSNCSGLTGGPGVCVAGDAAKGCDAAGLLSVGAGGACACRPAC